MIKIMHGIHSPIRNSTTTVAAVSNKFMSHQKLFEMSYRNWCFTLNNYTTVEYQQLEHMICQRECENDVCRDLAEHRLPCTYTVFQKEAGLQGTAHIQGYLELSRTSRVPGLKNFPPLFRAHLERRRGTQQQAIDYCKKDETRLPGTNFVEKGQSAHQGARIDLESIRQHIDEGETELWIAENYFRTWCRNYRAFAKYRLLKRGNRRTLRPVPDIEIHWGISGSGKSHQAYERFPDAYWLARPEGNVLYFDGVTERTTVLIFDDFYSWVKYDLLLRVCDKYPLKLKVHGGFVECPDLTHIIFTSNQDPRLWYTEYARMGGWRNSAFKRRIDDKGRITHYPIRWNLAQN